MASVLLEHLTKRFDKVTAVKDLSLSIEDGEFVVLIGASGCGKTTTLNMIAGLEEVTEGEIYVDGQTVTHLPPRDRNMAMVFQNYALYPHMTVYHNMAFGLRMRKMPRPEIKRRVNDAAEILGLGGLLERKPKELSGGQRQRVALGRAIVRAPKVFLFDEPLSNLDARLRGQMRAELARLHERLETTMIYVTHDQVEAMSLASKLVLLNDGVCQQVGPPLSVYEKPANVFVAGFIGSPPMNFCPARILGEGSRLWVETCSLKLPVPEKDWPFYERLAGRELIFGLRPEDIAPETETKAGEVFPVEVDLVEPLGAVTQLTLICGGQRLVTTVSLRQDIRPREVIRVGFNMDRMHLFEADEPHWRVSREASG
ncbi:MAG: sn-glycerol-3-phosphate ABC transporter ATP-binding protein UgpC [Deltaproteobacteria bacterium]|nr:sn-glycerol-3-phosphate ABC transporter ATP-binding protein UgpC [Deltaproteobacteria bacterium]